MKLSRRIWLKHVGVGVALAPLLAQAALAQAKASKEAMKYQEKPNNGQRCDGCMQFVAGAKPGANGTCKVVDGPISPSGWCIAFVKKS